MAWRTIFREMESATFGDHWIMTGWHHSCVKCICKWHKGPNGKNALVKHSNTMSVNLYNQ